jgi:ABC-type branched-subunit amino acid transport system substrate-binding protein
MSLRLPVFAAMLASWFVTTPRAELLAQSGGVTYANTPVKLLPYGKFRKPYKFFFAEPVEFLGPGRDKRPPPDLTEVRIGFLAPLEDSRDAELGERMLNGVTLAIEEANATGGYRGLPFVLVTRNDTGLWGASSNELVELDEEGVWATVGAIDGANTHIMLRLAFKLDMPLVNTGSTDPTLTETAIPWMVRVVADDRQNGYALAWEIHERRGYTRVAVLRANDRYGRVGSAEFEDAMKRLGSPILFELRYGSGDTTFTSQLDRIHRADVQAVVLWGSSEETGRIVRQMRGLGMQEPVFGPDLLVSETFLEFAGQAAEGVVATYPYNPTLDDPILQAFNRRYYERFGEEAEAFAAHAYDGMTLLIGAIRNAGLNRVRIRDELTGVKTFRGVTGTIPFDATWNDVGPVWMAEVRGGRFVFFPSPLDGQ